MAIKSVNKFNFVYLFTKFSSIIIDGIIEVNKRKCFNCRVTQTKQWFNLLKEHYLCKQCGEYKIIYGKFRSKELWFKTAKVIFINNGHF